MGDQEAPPVVVHHQNLKFNSATTLPRFKVIYRDPATGERAGPVPVIFNGQRYMCVSTDRGPVWVPSQAVKSALNQQDKLAEEQQADSHEQSNQVEIT